MRKHQTLEQTDKRIIDPTSFIEENHGTSGPIHTSLSPWKLGLEYDVVKAASNVAGYATQPSDPWGGDHIGFYYGLGAVSRGGPKNGKRSYAARGYLEENFGRPNLKITTESLVTKIEPDGVSAVGASYQSHGQKYTARARREVIVCSGAFASPQILEV